MKSVIRVIYSSHLGVPLNNKFNDHIYQTIGESNSFEVTIHPYENYNQYSLTEVYNKALNELDKRDAIFVFCHNDIEFDTKDWGKILLNHFNKKQNNYQIIGVAGSTELNSHGCWWLDASGKNMNFTKMIGIVNHDNGIRKWESRYSEPHFGVKPVVLIDGLFMAIDPEEIEHNFDESFKGFHYYDLSFCFPNYLDRCNIGVITDIRITHRSVGMTNQEWENNRQQFAIQYADELPAQV